METTRPDVDGSDSWVGRSSTRHEEGTSGVSGRPSPTSTGRYLYTQHSSPTSVDEVHMSPTTSPGVNGAETLGPLFPGQGSPGGRLPPLPVKRPPVYALLSVASWTVLLVTLALLTIQTLRAQSGSCRSTPPLRPGVHLLFYLGRHPFPPGAS